MENSETAGAQRAQVATPPVETIAESGLNTTTFAPGPERAGKSSPRTCDHCDDTDDLDLQVVADLFTVGSQFIVQRINSEDNAVGRIRAYLESNLQFLREHPVEVAALTKIGSRLCGADGEGHNAGEAQGRSVLGLEALLQEGQEAGELREFDALSMAVIMRGAIEAGAQRLIGEPGLDFDNYISEVVRTFTLAVADEGAGNY